MAAFEVEVVPITCVCEKRHRPFLMMMSAALRYVGPEPVLANCSRIACIMEIEKEEEEEEERRRREEEVEKEGGRVGHLVAFDLGHLRGPLARACIHNITIALYTNTVYNGAFCC